ncbi:hypothetical protein E2562_018930 [Oryza meyeriana var. granulata]|uniref:Secreted protein n=1 Tax=Oryza meyeriana var. granulata TaxID=110450 RepID=A0A6G1DLS4_9ORYZ|nr:hypothetical protein E2562_018930 [Oryza meyeriana var. granulata]
MCCCSCWRTPAAMVVLVMAHRLLAAAQRLPSPLQCKRSPDLEVPSSQHRQVRSPEEGGRGRGRRQMVSEERAGVDCA